MAFEVEAGPAACLRQVSRLYRTIEMKRVLTIGLTYTGEPVEGVEFENLGLCRPSVAPDRAASPLYEYDTIVINPQSFTHFIFGQRGPHSGSPGELYELKSERNDYDFDNVIDLQDRRNEMKAAIARGTIVVLCLAEPRRMNFFGYRESYSGYLAPGISNLIRRSDLLHKKGRMFGDIDPESPFHRYFRELEKSGWTLCLSDTRDLDGYKSIASTPEGYSLGGRVMWGSTVGWLITPPTSPQAENQMIRDSLALQKCDPQQEKYHSLFLSHTHGDKPFVRRLCKDLMSRGVRVWLDEAEIEIGDSLITKIEEGMKLSRYIGVVLSARSINAPWVKKELDVAMNREISQGESVVLPLLYDKCELPEFLRGKLYADFTNPDEYDEMLGRLLRRLRIS